MTGMTSIQSLAVAQKGHLPPRLPTPLQYFGSTYRVEYRVNKKFCQPHHFASSHRVSERRNRPRRHVATVAPTPPIEKQKFLSAERERILVKQAKQGGTSALRELLNAFAPLINRCAEKYRGLADADDLLVEGQAAFARSVKSFAPEKGNRLASYARTVVRNSMLAVVQEHPAYPQARDEWRARVKASFKEIDREHANQRRLWQRARHRPAGFRTVMLPGRREKCGRPVMSRASGFWRVIDQQGFDEQIARARAWRHLTAITEVELTNRRRLIAAGQVPIKRYAIGARTLPAFGGEPLGPWQKGCIAPGSEPIEIRVDPQPGDPGITADVADESSPEAEAILVHDLKKLGAAMQTLTSRDRGILTARFPSAGEPKTYARIAADLKLSISGVRKIENRILARMRRQIGMEE